MMPVVEALTFGRQFALRQFEIDNQPSHDSGIQKAISAALLEAFASGYDVATFVAAKTLSPAASALQQFSSGTGESRDAALKSP